MQRLKSASEELSAGEGRLESETAGCVLCTC